MGMAVLKSGHYEISIKVNLPVRPQILYKAVIVFTLCGTGVQYAVALDYHFPSINNSCSFR